MLKMRRFRRPEDQSRIRIAISLRRVDARDVPASAQAPLVPVSSGSVSASGPGPSQKKRKAAFQAAYGSQKPSTAQPSQSQPSASTSQMGRNATQAIVVEDEVEEVVPEDQPIDELYVTLRTSIVGVQYYKGMFSSRYVFGPFICRRLNQLWVIGLVGEGEEVRIVREPQNRYDR